MNKWTKLALSATATVGLMAGVVGTSYAAEPTPAPNANPPRVWQQGSGTATGYGRGIGYQTMSEAMTKLLGISAQEVHAARLAGKSLVQIAQSKGKGETDVTNALLAARKAALDARVKSGAITQAQADAAYKLMQERVKSSVNRTEVGPNRPADSQRLGLGPGAGAGVGASNGQSSSGRGPGLYNRWGAPANR